VLVTAPALRPYQQQGDADINAAWQAGARNVLYVLPTGAGKTVMFSRVLAQHQGAGVAIAHRQELVGQISLSLARFGLRHRIIGPRNVIKVILEAQRAELGQTYYDPNGAIAVAGVDTLIRRGDALAAWMRQVTLWVQDEAHHVLRANKWGKAVDMFPNARGLGVTATPERADGKGLGRHADGVMDTMVCGPSMRDLIDAGYLADYRIFAPPSDLDLAPVRIATDGDYNRDDLKTAVRKSHLVGDVVAHYQRIAPGKLGVTFATDVETAASIADQYNAAGVPAAMVSAKTPDAERNRLIMQFRARNLLQLVNVDLFGEGFDVPGIEVVSMARPTQSFAVFAQQFGRALRPLPGKEHGLIIDHASNVLRPSLGLPDAPRNWTLDARERGARRERDPEAIPITACTTCFRTYEAVLAACPFCGHKPEPAGRSKPEQVDGDLHELDPGALAALRGAVERVDGPARVPMGMTGPAAQAVVNRWRERQEGQAALREHIALWAGYRRAEGMTDSEIMRRFWFRFGTDIMTAQTLGAREAGDLTARISDAIG
jgi:superfamily II DNA or RNA helicase